MPGAKQLANSKDGLVNQTDNIIISPSDIETAEKVQIKSTAAVELSNNLAQLPQL